MLVSGKIETHRISYYDFCFNKDMQLKINSKIGIKIKRARESLRMTQSELARDIGVTFQQVQKYERGKNRISIAMLFVVAKILKRPVQYFLMGINLNNGNQLDECELNENNKKDSIDLDENSDNDNDYDVSCNYCSIDEGLKNVINDFSSILDDDIKKVVSELIRLVSYNFSKNK